MHLVSFDTESTDLKALMGRMLCASFVPITSDARTNGEPVKPYTFRCDDRRYKGRNLRDQKKLVIAIRDEIERYNGVVTWNGKLHDIPLLNAFLRKFNERPVKPQFHIDMMYYARGGSLKIGSSKLVNVQKYFGLSNEKTDLDWETWQDAGSGDTKALDYVVEHCEADVEVLREVYWHLVPMVANVHR